MMTHDEMIMKKQYDIWQQFYVVFVAEWEENRLTFYNDRFGLHSTIEAHPEGLTDGEIAEELSEIASGLYPHAVKVTLLNWWAI